MKLEHSPLVRYEDFWNQINLALNLDYTLTS